MRHSVGILAVVATANACVAHSEASDHFEELGETVADSAEGARLSETLAARVRQALVGIARGKTIAQVAADLPRLDYAPGRTDIPLGIAEATLLDNVSKFLLDKAGEGSELPGRMVFLALSRGVITLDPPPGLRALRLQLERRGHADPEFVAALTFLAQRATEAANDRELAEYLSHVPPHLGLTDVAQLYAVFGARSMGEFVAHAFAMGFLTQSVTPVRASEPGFTAEQSARPQDFEIIEINGVPFYRVQLEILETIARVGTATMTNVANELGRDRTYLHRMLNLEPSREVNVLNKVRRVWERSLAKKLSTRKGSRRIRDLAYSGLSGRDFSDRDRRAVVGLLENAEQRKTLVAHLRNSGSVPLPRELQRARRALETLMTVTGEMPPHPAFTQDAANVAERFGLFTKLRATP